ncbi:hypothetical protein L3Q82_015804 [Scortum barcoo]|uniref:Uncharacterized protein n=1 Tax=Scortum barcoo TaxID=214431 RepID=A0ACB8VNV7_9TELE|nr:hypothetical protein L3Q82_015804 [Scortum barcoo]
MDTLIVPGVQLSPVKAFDQVVETRAEKREHLRGRNNVTSCRSPTREFDTRQIKNELKEKRHQEFLRRRSVSPEPGSVKKKRSPRPFSMRHYSSFSKSEKLHSNIPNTPTSNGRPLILKPNSSINDGPSTNEWALLWSEQVTPMRQEKGHARTQASTSTSAMKELNQHRTKSTDKRENSVNAQKTSTKTLTRTENIHQIFSVQTENIRQKKIMRDTSGQTESGLVTVKESDIQRLADYLQEALWREETLKKKLAALQESTTNLLNSSNKMWTARCSEDLLRNKIKTLEAQLQVCLQKFPKDGVKKLVLQMEKQKLVYEEKAMVAVQKATQEKTEALSNAETLKEALITAKAESVRWQSLYEELKLTSAQLRENQHLNNEQLQQLQNQVELLRARETELRNEGVLLRQEKQELEYNVCLLKEDNRILREELQHLRGKTLRPQNGSTESQDFEMQGPLMSEEAEPRLPVRRDSQVEEQLRQTQEKLLRKERECEELQTELHAMEHECQSSQARLSQCRDELRQLSNHRRRPESCVAVSHPPHTDLQPLSFTHIYLHVPQNTPRVIEEMNLCWSRVSVRVKLKEVRDSKGEAIQALVKGLNRFDKSNSYSYVESERLGRKTYKEQYVYIYRNNVLEVKEHYQYPKREGDGTNETDVFSRQPFIVRFHSPTTLVKDFVLIGQHTCPKNAMKEIDELYNVFKGIYKKWKTDNVMILGDLNAGCSYVTIKGWRAVRLRSDPSFRWLIGDEQDTTVRQKTHCAYDRIIVHGREIISCIVPGSAKPFNFKENFHLTEEEALEMEQRLTDLLSDALSETSVPSHPDGDFEFENLQFDERFEDKTICHEDLPTKEDGALLQEATGQTAVLSSMETKDVYMAENAEEQDDDDEDFQGVGVMRMGITPEEDYTSSDGDSEQGSAVSGEDEEDEGEDTGAGEEAGDLLMSVCCSDEFCDGNKEDRIFAEGQPLVPEGAENPQVRNEEQGESESDEEVAYLDRVPERGRTQMMMKGDGIEEDEQEREEEQQKDLSDLECESMKIEQEEKFLTRHFKQEVENPYIDGPAKGSLESPEISTPKLQDLFAEVDSEKYVEKMRDFSGEEHQEAGESFAEYPSDFSSCEYVEDGGKNQESKHQSYASACSADSGSVEKQNIHLERAAAWMVRAEATDEEGDEYLYSRDLEADADKFRSLDVEIGAKDGGDIEIVEHVLARSDDGVETDESHGYSSSDDEAQVKGSDEELSGNMHLQELEENEQPGETHSGSCALFARWSSSDSHNRADPTDLFRDWDRDVLTDILLSEDLLTTEDTDNAVTSLSDVTQSPAEDVNSYSVVQTGDTKVTSPSNQGSLDDSFFFNSELEASGVHELGKLGDDEYEDERNWEQEQERIKAFYDFYDDNDEENGREGRQIKVQFCIDHLSQVIHYESDSSDRDSLSSSTDREEDLSSAETSEELKEPVETTQMQSSRDPPNTEPPETVPYLMSNQSNTQICTRKQKCVNMLKVVLTMGVVILTGLLMFWLVTDQAGWVDHASFF